MARTLLIVGSFAAIYLLWGSTYFAIALGLQSMPPFLLMGIRSLCGGSILIGLGGRNAIDASGRTWLNAGLCGLLFFVGCHGILALAQQKVPSGIAAIVLATIPFWIVLIDFLIPHGARP
jgi:drug/metabolite transporter (DMT)-like permease